MTMYKIECKTLKGWQWHPSITLPKSYCHVIDAERDIRSPERSDGSTHLKYRIVQVTVMAEYQWQPSRVGQWVKTEA